MNDNQVAEQFHDKFIRGKPLSAGELLVLENWYATQDYAERVALGLAKDEETISSLQLQIESAIARSPVVTTRIQFA